MTDITKLDGKWLIKGNLLLDDIELLLEQHAVVAGSDKLEINMSGVSEVDSVALSLMFEWLRQAKDNNCELVYSHLPANLISLATLYGLLDLIPQAAGSAASH